MAPRFPNPHAVQSGRCVVHPDVLLPAQTFVCQVLNMSVIILFVFFKLPSDRGDLQSKTTVMRVSTDAVVHCIGHRTPSSRVRCTLLVGAGRSVQRSG
jgi:hypothetical protein